jgi:hypothetical protein
MRHDRQNGERGAVRRLVAAISYNREPCLMR